MGLVGGGLERFAGDKIVIFIAQGNGRYNGL
jgi:hypothetical protein